jgi:YtkA-like
MPMRALVFISSIMLGSSAGLGCASSGPGESTTPPAFPADPLTTTTADDGVTRVEVRTAPAQPPARGVVDVELSVHDAGGAPLGGLSLSVVPWMIAHGHGASASPTVIDERNGHYWLRDVDLFMPGDWDLRVQMSGAVHTQVDARLEVQ